MFPGIFQRRHYKLNLVKVELAPVEILHVISNVGSIFRYQKQKLERYEAVAVSNVKFHSWAK